MRCGVGVVASKKSKEQMINRQKEKETKAKESAIIKNMNYSRRESR